MSSPSSNTSNFGPILVRHVRCYTPCTIQYTRVTLRSGAHPASRSGRMRGNVLALACWGEHSSAEERAYQDNADEVDAQSPPGLRITSGADPMNGRERKDAQRQYMQPPPPGIANARAQPGADADGDAQVQRYNPESHPYWPVGTGERDEDFAPSKVGEGIYPDRQDMHNDKDRAEQRQKVMQFAVEQARPAVGRLELCRKRQSHCNRQGE